MQFSLACHQIYGWQLRSVFQVAQRNETIHLLCVLLYFWHSCDFLLPCDICQ